MLIISPTVKMREFIAGVFEYELLPRIYLVSNILLSQHYVFEILPNKELYLPRISQKEGRSCVMRQGSVSINKSLLSRVTKSKKGTDSDSCKKGKCRKEIHFL